MCRAYNCFTVSASIVLTLTFVAVGISFFGPYWLSNVPSAAVNELNFTNGTPFILLSPGYGYYQFQDRGLWAQCGVYCNWFWNNGYSLQTVLLTPLSQYTHGTVYLDSYVL